MAFLCRLLGCAAKDDVSSDVVAGPPRPQQPANKKEPSRPRAHDARAAGSAAAENHLKATTAKNDDEPKHDVKQPKETGTDDVGSASREEAQKSLVKEEEDLFVAKKAGTNNTDPPDEENKSARDAPAVLTLPASALREKSSSSSKDDARVDALVPPRKPPERTSSPALPHSWQIVAKQMRTESESESECGDDVPGGRPNKGPLATAAKRFKSKTTRDGADASSRGGCDVDLVRAVGQELTQSDDPTSPFNVASEPCDDDVLLQAAHSAGNNSHLTFGEAWRSFKQDEAPSGLGKLREYVSSNYVTLLRRMLAPDRERYRTAALGPRAFDFRGRRVRRDDFVVVNERDLDLYCSLWRDRDDDIFLDQDASHRRQQHHADRPPTRLAQALSSWVGGGDDADKTKKKRPREETHVKPDDDTTRRRYCVVYVHDVGGSRLAALSSLGCALDAGAAGYCAFDCTACGRSGGGHVSFGHFEKFDIAAVVAHLVSKTGWFTDVVLWGRGAGAVAAVKYAAGLEETNTPTESSWLSNYGADDIYDSVFGTSNNSTGSTGAGKASSSSSSGATHSAAANATEPARGTSSSSSRAAASPSSSSLKTTTTTETPSAPREHEEDGPRGQNQNRPWAYPSKVAVTFDAFRAPQRTPLPRCSRREQRVELARRFAASLELAPETSLWVVSKPPLVVTKVHARGPAHDLGVREGDQLAGIGSSFRLPHTHDEFAALLLDLAKRDNRKQLPVRLLRDFSQAKPQNTTTTTNNKPCPSSSSSQPSDENESGSKRAASSKSSPRGRDGAPAQTSQRDTANDDDSDSPLSAAQRRRVEPWTRPAGLVLDCVVDSPQSLVNALRDSAAQREPVLVALLEPLLASALDVLFHSVKKRAGFDAASIKVRDVARRVDVPALFGSNEFHDVDRGIPNLAPLAKAVYDAYGAESATMSSSGDATPGTLVNVKTLVKYNAPLRLALRGTLDAMSSKFLNKSFVFLQSLPGLKDGNAAARRRQQQLRAQRGSGTLADCAETEPRPHSPPRWVVTTRPWAQNEAEQFIDEYESAQISVDTI